MKKRGKSKKVYFCIRNRGFLDKDAMIRHIVSANSTFLNEGKNNLIEEFGEDYGT